MAHRFFKILIIFSFIFALVLLAATQTAVSPVIAQVQQNARTDLANALQKVQENGSYNFITESGVRTGFGSER